jgi:neutral ceramidase
MALYAEVRVWTIRRGRASASPFQDGVARAAARAVDITPDFNVLRTGWAVADGVRALHGRLYARILVLDDGHGERVALVGADLHAGFRPLTELVAATLAAQHPELALDLRRVLLAGTHTHSGPGQMYGTPFYDQKAHDAINGLTDDCLRPRVERMASAIVQGIVLACGQLAPARIGIGVACTENVGSNRSADAARLNVAAWGEGSAASALAADERALVEGLGDSALARGCTIAQAAALVSAWTGAPLPAAPTPNDLIDRRVRVVWAETVDGAPVGAFCTAAPHNAMLPARCKVASADVFGWASHLVARRWATPGGRPVVAMAAGALGDADPDVARWGYDAARALLQDRTSWDSPSEGHGAQVFGRAGELAADLAKVINAAIEDARSALTSTLRLDCRYAEPTSAKAPPSTLFPPGVSGGLTPTAIGGPTAGGSELGRGVGANEGTRNLAPSSADVRWPKSVFPLVLLRSSQRMLSPETPLHLVAIDRTAEGLGRTWLVGLPGEPTTFFARLMAEAVDPSDPSRPIVVGVCGDYRGYLTTPHEYVAQHYEGSSTLTGRHTARWYYHWLHEAASDHAGSDDHGTWSVGQVSMNEPEAWYAELRAAPGTVERTDLDIRFTVGADGGFVTISWSGRLPPDERALRTGPIVRIRALDENDEVFWSADDTEPEGLLYLPSDLLLGLPRWSWRVTLPPSVTVGTLCRVDVKEWHGAPTWRSKSFVR